MYECSYDYYFSDRFLTPLTKKGGKERKGRVGCAFAFLSCLFFPLFEIYLGAQGSKENLIDERTSKLLLEDGSRI